MPQTFRHIGIIGKLGAIRVQDALARTLAVLEQRNLRYSLDPDTVPPEYQAIPAARPVSAWDNVDLCIVIGGDGTFLYATPAASASSPTSPWMTLPPSSTASSPGITSANSATP